MNNRDFCEAIELKKSTVSNYIKLGILPTPRKIEGVKGLENSWTQAQLKESIIIINSRRLADNGRRIDPTVSSENTEIIKFYI